MAYCSRCCSVVCDCSDFLENSSSIKASDLINAQIEQKHKARQEMLDWQRRDFEDWRESISRDLAYRHLLRF